MGVRADGSAYCNRCNTGLPGVGVLHGMLAADLTAAGDVRELLFCYDPPNQCRAAVLTGHLTYASSGLDVCARCGAGHTAGVGEGMLTADLDPASPDQIQRLLFCYANGCRDQVLAGKVLY